MKRRLRLVVDGQDDPESEQVGHVLDGDIYIKVRPGINDRRRRRNRQGDWAGCSRRRHRAKTQDRDRGHKRTSRKESYSRIHSRGAGANEANRPPPTVGSNLP